MCQQVSTYMEIRLVNKTLKNKLQEQLQRMTMRMTMRLTMTMMCQYWWVSPYCCHTWVSSYCCHIWACLIVVIYEYALLLSAIWVRLMMSYMRVFQFNEWVCFSRTCYHMWVYNVDKYNSIRNCVHFYKLITDISEFVNVDRDTNGISVELQTGCRKLQCYCSPNGSCSYFLGL